MKNLLIYLTISLLVLISCSDKSTEPKQVNYSKLTVKVFNNNHEPIKGAKVSIYDIITEATIINDSTNASGEYASELLEGEYGISIRVKDGLVNYCDGTSIQLIAGINKVKEFNPYKNIGDIYLQLNNSNNEPLVNVNADLLSTTFNSSILGFNVYKAKAFKTVKSDGTGKILFENVPLCHMFGLLVYIDENNYYIPVSYGFQGYSKEHVPLFTVTVKL